MPGHVGAGGGIARRAQAVEHYEISRYGTLTTWPDKLGLRDAVTLLRDAFEGKQKRRDAEQDRKFGGQRGFSANCPQALA